MEMMDDDDSSTYAPDDEEEAAPRRQLAGRRRKGGPKREKKAIHRCDQCDARYTSLGECARANARVGLLASPRLVRSRLAPFRLAPLRLAPLRLARLRLAPLRSASPRLAAGWPAGAAKAVNSRGKWRVFSYINVVICVSYCIAMDVVSRKLTYLFALWAAR